MIEIYGPHAKFASVFFEYKPKIKAPNRKVYTKKNDPKNGELVINQGK